MIVEKDINVTTDNNGLPTEMLVDAGNSILHIIKIFDIYLQEPLVRSKKSQNGVIREIFGYKYKSHIYLNQTLITCVLIYLLEDDKWILQLKS